MAELAFPDAMPNFAGSALGAFQAGRQIAKQNKVDNALAMVGSNPDGARSALLQAGAIPEANAVGQYSDQQEEKRLGAQFATDPEGAMTSAVSGGRFDVAGQLAQMNSQQRALAAYKTDRLARVLNKLGTLPYEQRKGAIQQLAPHAAEEFGMKPEEVLAFDPTDSNIAVRVGQAMTLQEQIAEHDKQATNARADATLAETVRHNRAEEGKPVKLGENDTLVDVSGATGSGDSRAARNNNPLNLTVLPHGQWDGQSGTDGQFAVFSTPEAGLAAADKNLQAYGQNHGIDTVAGVIQRWAPPSENDTPGYIKTVAKDLGIDPNAKIDLSDPKVRQALLSSMSKVEVGGSPGEARVIARGGSSSGLTDAAIDLQAGMYLKTGKLESFGMGGAKDKRAIINRATDIAKGLGLSPEDIVSGTMSVKAAGQALNNVTKVRTAIQASEQTLDKNLDLMLSLAKKMGPTGVPVLNRWVQGGRKVILGDPDVAAFDAAWNTAVSERAKVMTTNTGSGGAAVSDSARKESEDALSKFASIPQLEAVVAVTKKDAANRSGSFQAIEDGIRGQLHNGVGGEANAAPGGQHASPPAGFKQAPDGNYYAPDPARRGKYLMWKP